jgi:hypothetical protein
MLIFKRLNLLVDSAVSVFENHDLQASETHNSCEEPSNKQAHQQARHLLVSNGVRLSEVLTTLVSLDYTRLRVYVGIAVGTFLPVLCPRINLENLICCISIVVIVVVVLEVVSRNCLEIQILSEFIDVFPTQFVRIPHVIVICWFQVGEV